jgi:integrase
LLDGVDPLEAKASAKAARGLAAAKTFIFQDAANKYFEQHKRKWKSKKHSDQFLSSLEAYAFPVIGKLSVAAIDKGLVLKCIEPIWTTIPETASRVRGRIETVLAWATVHDYRSGENPARWKGHLQHALPARGKTKEHHPALPFVEIHQFMMDLNKREGIAAKALEFTILTAARTGETIGATWSEIDQKTWTIPKERMKGGREHRVPLSDRAVAILKELPHEEGNPFIFIGPHQDGLSKESMPAVLRRMGRRDITVHGFRSTFRDWASETTAYPRDVCEMALAHVVKGVEGDYRRGDLLDKRRKLMEDWAKYCATAPVKTGAVVQLRGRR